MTFLAPSVLWGLLAAAIPLIIHLLSIRRTRKVEFSSIRFIKELEHETIRKLRLRQWLLLILRTLAIVFLVLVFARPVKVGYFPPWVAGDRKTKLAVLLDNSASMNGKYGGESFLQRSKNSVAEILAKMEGAFDLDVYQTTPLLRKFSRNLGSSLEISNALKNIEQSEGRDNLWEAIRGILKEAEFSSRATSLEANRECYIFSDFPEDIPLDWAPELAPDSAELNGRFDWRFYLFLQPDIEDNIAIASVNVLSQLRLPEHLVKVGTRITNQGGLLREDIPVQLYFDGDRVGQVVTDMEPGKSKDFVFQGFPKHSGFVHGIMELPADDYELDNRRFFQFSISPRIRCKIVGQSATGISLLAAALQAINKDSVFVITEKVISPSPTGLSLGKTDVLILVDPPVFKKSVVDEIERFLRRSGDIIVFLGDDYGEAKDHPLSTILSFPKARGTISLSGEAFHEVTHVETDHPLFAEFDLKSVKGEMPQVFSHVELIPETGSRVLLSLSNGDPLLVEFHRFGGTVLTFSSLPDLRWMDLPIRGLFVPLIHRMLVYLATDDKFDRSVVVGETSTIPLDRAVLSSEIEMSKPSGRRTLLVPDYQREVVAIDQIDEVGVYDLSADGRHFLSFVANVAESEDPTRRASEKQLLNHFPRERTKIVAWDDDAVATVMESRRGTEVWRPFLMAAVVVLALETWVGRVRKGTLKS